MTRRVSYTSAAEREIEQAVASLLRENPEAAARLAERLYLLEARLSVTPLMYPVMLRSIRGAWLHPFRYVVYYRVTDEEVVVKACLHTSRSPRAIRRVLRQR